MKISRKKTKTYRKIETGGMAVFFVSLALVVWLESTLALIPLFASAAVWLISQDQYNRMCICPKCGRKLGYQIHQSGGKTVECRCGTVVQPEFED